ncbi:MAG: CarR [uncultured bacterium]|nr:MAG: CarR [uncultured bacterium]
MEMVSNGIFVDVGNAAFLGAQAASEVAEVVDGERNVGIQCFANGLAVIDSLGISQSLEIGFQAIGNLQEQIGALGY